MERAVEGKIGREPAHAVPIWQAPASTDKKRPASRGARWAGGEGGGPAVVRWARGGVAPVRVRACFLGRSLGVRAPLGESTRRGYCHVPYICSRTKESRELL